VRPADHLPLPGTDEELVALFEKAKEDLEHYGQDPIELVADVPEPEIPE